MAMAGLAKAWMFHLGLQIKSNNSYFEDDDEDNDDDDADL